MTTTNHSDQLVAELGIDPAETRRRFAFLEFGPGDVAALTDLHAQLEARKEAGFFVEEFYRHLLNFEETRVFIADPARLARLKRTQEAYFHGLTLGEYGEDYVRYRLRVGVAHERIGLDPKWYLGAYRKYLSFMLPKVAEIYHGDNRRIEVAQQALVKIILFDMGLAIDTYTHAKQQSIRHQGAQLTALNEIAVALTASLNLTEILDRIMERGIVLSGSTAACVAFCNPTDWTFREWTTRGLSDHFVRNMNFRPGGLADETFVKNTHILSNDLPGTMHQLSKLARDEGIRSFVCLPLASHTQRLGVIYFYRTDRDTFEPAEIDLLGTFARLAAQAIENARMITQVGEEARTDSLTGLLNRRTFDRRMMKSTVARSATTSPMRSSSSTSITSSASMTISDIRPAMPYSKRSGAC